MIQLTWNDDGPTRAEIEAAFTTNPEFRENLLCWLRPRIQRKVDAILRPIAARYRRDRSFDVDVEDFTHDFLVALLDNRGRLLRNWDPDQVKSLSVYLWIPVREHLKRKFRRMRPNPWLANPMATEELVRMIDDSTIPERSTLFADVEYRLALESLLLALDATFTDEDRLRFDRLFKKSLSSAAVAKLEGCTENAIHQWISRLRRRLKDIVDMKGRGTPSDGQ